MYIYIYIHETYALCRAIRIFSGSMSHAMTRSHTWASWIALPPVLQCVAVCCRVLQCVALCCSVLQCVAVCPCHIQWRLHTWASRIAESPALQCVAVCCSVMHCYAVCCNVMYRVAVNCGVSVNSARISSWVIRNITDSTSLLNVTNSYASSTYDSLSVCQFVSHLKEMSRTH